MTIMVLCLKVVSKNNYQIEVKAVSSGGRKFCKPIQISYRPSLQLLCKKSPRSDVLKMKWIKLISLFTLSQVLNNHS